MTVLDIARKALHEKIKTQNASGLVCIFNPAPTPRQLKPAK